MNEKINYEADLEKRFTYHPPKDNQPDRYNVIRRYGKVFAETLVHNCPHSRELTRALNKIDEAVMLANAAIARNE